jgi:hypothetical protein
VFLIFLAAYRDRDYVDAATSSKLTIGTGDQDDAVVIALASNMTATQLDVSELAVTRVTDARRMCVLTLYSIWPCKASKAGGGGQEFAGLRTLPSLAYRPPCIARVGQIQCGISAQPFEQIGKLCDIHRNPSRLIADEQRPVGGRKRW